MIISEDLNKSILATLSSISEDREDYLDFDLGEPEPMFDFEPEDDIQEGIIDFDSNKSLTEQRANSWWYNYQTGEIIKLRKGPPHSHEEYVYTYPEQFGLTHDEIAQHETLGPAWVRVSYFVDRFGIEAYNVEGAKATVKAILDGKFGRHKWREITVEDPVHTRWVSLDDSEEAEQFVEYGRGWIRPSWESIEEGIIDFDNDESYKMAFLDPKTGKGVYWSESTLESKIKKCKEFIESRRREKEYNLIDTTISLTQLQQEFDRLVKGLSMAAALSKLRKEHNITNIAVDKDGRISYVKHEANS